MFSERKRASQGNITNIASMNKYIETEKQEFPKYYNKKVVSEVGMKDFNRLSTLGSGSFGRVILVQHKASKKYHALKILEKKKLVATEQVEHTLNEKNILQAVNHPLIVHMQYYFYDNSYLYFVMPFINGGELFNLIKKFQLLDEDLSRFYAAQVCLGLEYLHYLELVYRDLKPENILIDGTGYIKITDFGFCKLVKGRTYTLCGTPEYLAPEVVLSRGYNSSVDWWSYGILVFEMNAGYTPFKHQDTLILYDKIAAGKYKNPQHFSISLRDLLRNLLQVELAKRYGNLLKGVDDIKDHRWFKTINWLSLFSKTVEPPYKPQVSGPADTSNFVKMFDEPTLVVDATDKYNKEFAQF